MQFSSKQEQLRQLLKAQYTLLRQTFPQNRHDALLALVRAGNRHYMQSQHNNTIDHVSHFSLQKALSLCFSTEHIQENAVRPQGSPLHFLEVLHVGETLAVSLLPLMDGDLLNAWAASTLQTCARLAEAERILDYCDSGFMHMQQGNDADYSVWVASKKMPTEWREHEDLVWLTNFLKQTYVAEMHMIHSEKVHIQQQLADFGKQWNGQMFNLYKTTRTIDEYYHRLGVLHVKSMSASTTYPDSTRIGGCTFATYRDVLGILIGLALKHLDMSPLKDLCRDRCITSLLQSVANEDVIHRSLQYNDTLLIEALATTLALDNATVRLALDAYTLDAENVSYHTSTTEVPAPPLIRLDEQHRVLSLEGLLTYPLFFLTRELKRKYSSEYHTASQLREEIFRQDVYALFADKRFVKSAGHVELRGTKGTLTTDVDALIFDRKTGTLALFELKSQDPFAYSPQERIRQRDYFYGASKQVIVSSEWVKRNGANTLLSRLDSTQVKRLKVQNVFIFVLGRYLAHFFDGPSFDSRAAWGTWSQVLHLIQGKPFGADDTNPIQALHNKLKKDTPLALADKSLTTQEIGIENERIHVYPSFEAYRNSKV